MKAVSCWLWMLGLTLGQWSDFAAASTPPGCDGEVDLVFVLDSSESLRDSAPSDQPLYNYGLLKDFCNQVVQRLAVDSGDSRVAMLQYSTESDVIFHLDRHATSIRVQDAITKMAHKGGNTNTAGALRRMRREVFHKDHGERKDSRKVAVVLTDGLSNIGLEDTVTEASTTRDGGVEIYTVAATKYVDEVELINIASKPSDIHVLHVLRFEELEDIVEVLVHRICGLPDPSTTPAPEGCSIEGCARCPDSTTCEECQKGWYPVGSICRQCLEHCDICRGSETCDVCQVGYYWDPTSDRCEECELIADMALVIDVSGSIQDKNPDDMSYDNYGLLKNFINSLVERLDVRANQIRLGAVRFSNSAWLMFNLDTYSNHQQIQADISDMKYGGGETNTSGAIRVMRQQLFNTDHGDREDVPNVALVITDGESNKDQNLTLPEAELAKQEGVTFFVVGITDDINEDEVRGIATDPDQEHYFESPDIKHLDQLLFQILKEVCDPRNTAAVGDKADNT